MRWSEIERKAKKKGYKEGKRTRHFTIWDCPCPNKAHPIYLQNHPSGECRYFNSLKKKMGHIRYENPKAKRQAFIKLAKNKKEREQRAFLRDTS